jgi:mannosyl-oligosaccharide alpha-1,2-mannosidase
MIQHAYSGYAKYAWGANEHRPISKTGHTANVFGSHTLGISIIDSLDTIYLADLKQFFQKSREWIETQFNPNVASEISAFEINIRLVGGFLAIYALTDDKLYLDKAQMVANLLLPAFDTPTGIPYALITLSTGASKNWNWAAGGCSILSELGTMHLEFQYLSQLTGKDIYLQKVEKIRKVLKEASENNMYYNYINPQTGKWCQKQASLGGLGDSFYEYLLKSWVLSGKKDEQARSMYEGAMKAAEESMLRKTPTTNLMYFGEQRSGRLDPQMGHLTCFVGGLYILSIQTGALVNSSSDKHELEIAQGIGKTCRESYIRAPTGLGPEGFHFERVDVEAKSLRDNEKYYILRPEAIETWFYLWRHTHDQIYRDWAWDAVIALEKYCRVEGGYSGIRDVYSIPVSHDDVQQSFFIAETLKYLLLIFSDDTFIPLDTYVFNTEAHPFRIRKL